MINKTFDIFWRDISPFAVGFDRTFDALSLLADSKSQTTNYPPYNIRKVSDEQYTIELAVAGFEEKDIEIEAEEDQRPDVDVSMNEQTKAAVRQSVHEVQNSIPISEVVDDALCNICGQRTW